MPFTTDPKIRFWRFITKTSTCWVWDGKTDRNGYGLFRDSPTSWMLAHRFSWTINHGRIPEDDLVLHYCDIPGCVNPDHLFLGTHQDNMNDMLRKNRGMVGRRKLTPEKIQKARDLLCSGLSQDKTAVLLEVSQGTISKIHRGMY